MAKTKAKPSLLELAKALPKLHQNWFDKLPPDQKSQLEELRTAYHAGELEPQTPGTLFLFCREQLGIRIARNTFGEWLRAST